MHRAHCTVHTPQRSESARERMKRKKRAASRVRINERTAGAAQPRSACARARTQTTLSQTTERVVRAFPALLLRLVAIGTLCLDHMHLLTRAAVDGSTQAASTRGAAVRRFTAAPALGSAFQRVRWLVAHSPTGERAQAQVNASATCVSSRLL